jgi:uncharacterized protein (UPF0332 family)
MNAAALAFEISDYETVASRAYYAAYHAIVAAFEARLGINRPRWSHYFLPYFGRVPEVADLRINVSYLYEMRRRADYENAPLSKADAERVLVTARAVVDKSSEVISRGQI